MADYISLLKAADELRKGIGEVLGPVMAQAASKPVEAPTEPSSSPNYKKIAEDFAQGIALIQKSMEEMKKCSS